ncbi:MAG: arginine repressor [Planctomycetes bacterium]|nr:arginine repressor [Planctomycetota bacterium]
MATMATRIQRLQLITRLITGGAVMNQRELARQLAARGIETTQATLSRDLAEMGVLKSAAGYSLPSDQSAGHSPSATDASRNGLSTAVRRLLVCAKQAGTLSVIHTPPGQASALAIEMDRVELPGKIGTIAGDDCILVACTSCASAKALTRSLLSLATVASGGTTANASPASNTAARARTPAASPKRSARPVRLGRRGR